MWSRLRSGQAKKTIPRIINSGQGAHLEIDGKSYLNFCSSHYLGFAVHPRLKKAAQVSIPPAFFSFDRILVANAVMIEFIQSFLSRRTLSMYTVLGPAIEHSPVLTPCTSSSRKRLQSSKERRQRYASQVLTRPTLRQCRHSYRKMIL